MNVPRGRGFNLSVPALAISCVALVASLGGGFAIGAATAPKLTTTTVVGGPSGNAYCPAGYSVTGGGFTYGNNGFALHLRASLPITGAKQGWHILDGAGTLQHAYAVCSKVG